MVTGKYHIGVLCKPKVKMTQISDLAPQRAEKTPGSLSERDPPSKDVLAAHCVGQGTVLMCGIMECILNGQYVFIRLLSLWNLG